MRHRSPKSRQAGVVIVPLLVMALGMVLLAILLGTALASSRGIANSFKSQQRDYMVELQGKLSSWYGRHLFMEADSSVALSSEELFAEIGAERRFGLRLVLSPQLDDGAVLFHKVAIVAPGNSANPGAGGDSGAYDAAGIFAAPSTFSFIEFDGKAAQHKALADTNQKLAQIAGLLEQYVGVRISADAGSDAAFNYFRPMKDCSYVATGELPCTNGEMAASDLLQLDALKGMASGVTVWNAWGGAINVSNDVDASSPAAPYTMLVTTKTPWNSSLFVKAVQPTL